MDCAAFPFAIVEFVVDMLRPHLAQLVDECPRHPRIVEQIERPSFGLAKSSARFPDQRLIVSVAHQASRFRVVYELLGVGHLLT